MGGEEERELVASSAALRSFPRRVRGDQVNLLGVPVGISVGLRRRRSPNIFRFHFLGSSLGLRASGLFSLDASAVPDAMSLMPFSRPFLVMETLRGNAFGGLFSTEGIMRLRVSAIWIFS